MFYHDIKPHMSPSALAQWLGSRGSFVRSYFAEERGPETKAMTAGTEIHALVEAGIIKAQHVYDNAEQELKVQVPGTDFYFLGRPDGYGGVLKIGGGVVSFVDYKSGKANGWDEKLPTDIKMRATAWLIWVHSGQPEEVIGHVEFIQTTWDEDQKKLVPIDGKETEVSKIVYTGDEMRAFTRVVVAAMEEVNEFYEKWKGSTGDFVSRADVERAVELRRSIDASEMELTEVEDRILTQMEFGGEETHKTPYGSFFIKTTKTYEYPKTLQFKLDGQEDFTLEKAERVAAGVSAAKKNFELANDPKEVKRSVNFRRAKEK